MSSYKVLQDIEAEDTLIGPLTLRQCIYGAIALLNMWFSGIAISKHVGVLVILFLPFIAFGIFFAIPWSKQQPTEVWALAKIRFFFKPRKRIWNQSGVRQLVTITAPKVVKQPYRSHLSPSEVKSRLKALADTIDTRGWATRNIDLGYYTGQVGAADSDRLINAYNLPQEVSSMDMSMPDDMFDVQNNATAQKLDTMIAQQTGVRRQQIMQQMSRPATTAPINRANYWHMRTVTPPVHINRQGSEGAPSGILPTPIDPATAQASVTANSHSAILELANNNDLNVATIAREASARSTDKPDEVEVSLH